MTKPNKIAFVWWPRRLMQHNGVHLGFDQIGWAWMQKALLKWNINYGYIAFVEDQTEENFEKVCKACGRPL